MSTYDDQLKKEAEARRRAKAEAQASMDLTRYTKPFNGTESRAKAKQAEDRLLAQDLAGKVEKINQTTRVQKQLSQIKVERGVTKGVEAIGGKKARDEGIKKEIDK